MDDLSIEEKDAIMQRIFFLALTGIYREQGNASWLELAFFVESQIGKIKRIGMTKVLEVLKANDLVSYKISYSHIPEEGRYNVETKRWSITDKGLKALQIA